METISFLSAHFKHLTTKEMEYGGIIKLENEVVREVRIIKGTKEKVWKGFETPEIGRKMHNDGWVFFHSHPIDGEPSFGDEFLSHLVGPCFVLTPSGIWRLRPAIIIPFEKFKALYERNWERAQQEFPRLPEHIKNLGTVNDLWIAFCLMDLPPVRRKFYPYLG
jgi:hypothetical protein